MAAKKKSFALPSWIPWIGKQKKEGQRSGVEDLDPSPVAMPLGSRRPERLEDQIARLVRSEQYKMAMMGDDTIEEANDFDIPEDFDPSSPFETEFDENLGREITPQEWAERGPQLMAEVKKRNRNNARLEEEYLNLEEALAERRQRAREEQRGSKGVTPSPSSEGPKGPPA